MELILVPLLLCGVIGNIFAVIISSFVAKKKQDWKVFNVFIISTAAAEFLVSIFLMVIVISLNNSENISFINTVAGFERFFEYLTYMMNSASLVVIVSGMELSVRESLKIILGLVSFTFLSTVLSNFPFNGGFVIVFDLILIFSLIFCIIKHENIIEILKTQNTRTKLTLIFLIAIIFLIVFATDEFFSQFDYQFLKYHLSKAFIFTIPISKPIFYFAFFEEFQTEVKNLLLSKSTPPDVIVATEQVIVKCET